MIDVINFTLTNTSHMVVANYQPYFPVEIMTLFIGLASAFTILSWFARGAGARDISAILSTIIWGISTWASIGASFIRDPVVTQVMSYNITKVPNETYYAYSYAYPVANISAPWLTVLLGVITIIAGLNIFYTYIENQKIEEREINRARARVAAMEELDEQETWNYRDDGGRLR
jgi:hypothetical protein